MPINGYCFPMTVAAIISKVLTYVNEALIIGLFIIILISLGNDGILCSSWHPCSHLPLHCLSCPLLAPFLPSHASSSAFMSLLTYIQVKSCTLEEDTWCLSFWTHDDLQLLLFSCEWHKFSFLYSWMNLPYGYILHFPHPSICFWNLQLVPYSSFSE